MATAPKNPSAETPSAPGVHPKALWSFKPRSDREAGDAIVANFALHWFRPRSSSPRSTGATPSGWGRSAPRCCCSSSSSGLPLLFLYVPSVERAYGSVKDIEWVVTFGSGSAPSTASPPT